MAVSYTGAMTGTVSGLPDGSSATGTYTYTNAASPGLDDLMNLTTTPTAVTFPTGCLFVEIVPPSTNTTNLRASGAVGETTGLTLHPTNPVTIPVPTSSPVLYLFAQTGTINNVQLRFR